MSSVPANTEAKQIAETALSQLGGNKFRVMTGAHDIFFDTEKNGDIALILKFKGCTKFNCLRVIYNFGPDTYTIKLLKWSRAKMQVIAEKCHTGIYADMLQEIFTAETGLRTSL